MIAEGRPFVGSEAIANGMLKKHHLRAAFQLVFPDVYVDKNVELTLRTRAVAGWLWSHREGVLAGLTAAALHGAQWVDDSLPIELVWPNARCPNGIRTSDVRLRTGELATVGGLRVTTPARTAFDIGRRGRLDDAVARLDALGNATGVTAADIRTVAHCHRGARGLRQLEAACDLFDAGAASPKETWLRLLVLRAGYPPPQTQIPVLSADGRRRYYLDMGWRELMLALEYDGEHHRLDSRQYARDIWRLEDLNQIGWATIRVIRHDRAADVLRRIDRVWASRLRTDRDGGAPGDLTAVSGEH